MKKKNVQAIKHVIGVLTAEGSGNEIIDHCVRELAALIEKDETASDTASRKEEANPPPETHAETVVVDSLFTLAAELKQFLVGREENDEREILAAIFRKFDCKNVDLAAILGVPPNMIAKVKSGRFRSPTLANAIREFMEGGK